VTHGDGCFSIQSNRGLFCQLGIAFARQRSLVDRRRLLGAILTACAFWLFASGAFAQALWYPWDPTASRVEVLATHTGPFAFLAPARKLRAKTVTGGVFWEEKLSRPLAGYLEIPSDSLELADPGASDSERKHAQEVLFSPKILWAKIYPVIRYDAKRFIRSGPGKTGTVYRVEGVLLLRGKSREVTGEIACTRKDRRIFLSGGARILLSSFGIERPSLPGRLLTVSNLISVEVALVGREGQPGN
jgi:polyisoprenoid-binding protein YceI